MKLHEFDDLVAGCVNEDTGEVDAERLGELIEERKKKIEALALYTLTLKAEAEAVDKEIERLENKLSALVRKRTGIRDYLIANLNGEGFKSPMVSVSKPRISERLVVDDESKIPEGFFEIVQKKKLCSASVKQAIIEGWKTDAAHVEQTVSVTIR